MVLPDPEWEPVGSETASVHIHKDNGRLYWNARVQQYLGKPSAVKLERDDELGWLGILQGDDYAVVKDEDGNYYIDAKEALEECGLIFPLDDHWQVTPEQPLNSHNRVVIPLE